MSHAIITALIGPGTAPPAVATNAPPPPNG